MNYKETTEWLFNQLPMYQTMGAAAYKEDLTHTKLLLEHLGNPEKKIKCIHVAGTNGKGSTSHLLASVYQEAGYKVGLYTSPHLKDYRERIKINGIEISKQFVCDFISENKAFFEKHQLSFFEMTVGLAFAYFNQSNTDINIIEVGLGGRLDATNVITPLLSVITNIGLDHVQFLGDTLEKIAFEKGGIIKPKIPVVIGEYTVETKPVFEKIALYNQSAIQFASNMNHPEYPCELKGDYQKLNKKTVLTAIQTLAEQLPINEKIIKNGFEKVIQNTGLLGRWQQINSNPKTICDTAHNAHGLAVVMSQLKNESFENLHLVLGFVNDKDLDKILPLFPKNAQYYFSKPSISRGLDEKIVQEKAAEFGLIGTAYNSISEAYKAAQKEASKKDFIYIGGSTFTVAEVL
jgi:dihydrofolate synthase/folylpolyglutamate synthase